MARPINSGFAEMRSIVTACHVVNGPTITRRRFDLSERQLAEVLDRDGGLSLDTRQVLARFMSAPPAGGDGNTWTEKAPVP